MTRHNQLTLADIKRRRARGERIPADIEAALAHATDRITRILQDFDAWVHSGDAEADWALVIWPDVPDADRLAACHRIVGRMHGRPIYRERWAANANRLRLALEERGISIEKDLAPLNTWQAVFETVADWTRAEVTADDEGATRKVRQALQKLICEDLLGPEWRRHQHREAELSLETLEKTAATDPEYERVEWLAELNTLVEAARLTPTQQQTLDVLLMPGGDYGPAVAEALGVEQGTWRKRKHDLIAALTDVRAAHQRDRASPPSS